MVRVSRARQALASGRGRKMRERAKLSTRELAGMVGVDQSTIARWERGETVPSAEDALAWSTAMERLGFKV